MSTELASETTKHIHSVSLPHSSSTVLPLLHSPAFLASVCESYDLRHWGPAPSPAPANSYTYVHGCRYLWDQVWSSYHHTALFEPTEQGTLMSLSRAGANQPSYSVTWSVRPSEAGEDSCEVEVETQGFEDEVRSSWWVVQAVQVERTDAMVAKEMADRLRQKVEERLALGQGVAVDA